MSDNINNEKEIYIRVTKSMVKKISVVFEGDVIKVSHRSDIKILRGQLCFISHNEKQWIEYYWPGLRKRYRNIYPIVRVIMNS